LRAPNVSDDLANGIADAQTSLTKANSVERDGGRVAGDAAGVGHYARRDPSFGDDYADELRCLPLNGERATRGGGWQPFLQRFPQRRDNSAAVNRLTVLAA